MTFLEEEMATHSSILALKIQWADVSYISWGSKELDTAEHKHTYTHLEIRGLSSC